MLLCGGRGFRRGSVWAPAKLGRASNARNATVSILKTQRLLPFIFLTFDKIFCVDAKQRRPVPLFVCVRQCERVFTWEEYRYTSSFRWPGRGTLLLSAGANASKVGLKEIYNSARDNNDPQQCASSWNCKDLFGHCGRGLSTSQQAGKPTQVL